VKLVFPVFTILFLCTHTARTARKNAEKKGEHHGKKQNSGNRHL
jgi:hypothetical protein